MATTEEIASWRRVIAEQEGGDETQGEFCKRRGMKLATFRNWKYRLARGDVKRATRVAPLSFVPVRVVARAEQAASAIELVLGEGHVVRVPRGFDAETLKRLVETLEVRPC